MRLGLIVEYEGTRYHGFQYQVNAPSIQEELEKAVQRLTGEKLRVKTAGRTDAGVHATGQVVAFDTESRHGPETFVGALNFYLPDDIAVRAAYSVRKTFDPRRDALSRKYRYTILGSPTRSPLMRRTAHLVQVPLNVGNMRRAAKHLIGEHDFTRFSGPLEQPDASTVRSVYGAFVRKSGGILRFDVEGSSFLPHQVRRMVGALVDIGRNALSMEEFRIMLDGGRSEAIARSLPPQGLCLMEVTYADFPPKVGEPDDN
jgi:tRNA pseudouridine38-40 synthase